MNRQFGNSMFWATRLQGVTCNAVKILTSHQTIRDLPLVHDVLVTQSVGGVRNRYGEESDGSEFLLL